MRHLRLSSLLVRASLVALIIFWQGAIAPALGTDCGTGIGPCSCGDRVITSTKLGGSDPVLRMTCPCHGLIVASGVTLDIGGTIRGTGPSPFRFCVGVLLEDVSDVVIKHGKVVGFAFGVAGYPFAEPTTTNVTVAGVQALDNDEGIHLEGSGLLVKGNIARRNQIGIAVFSESSSPSVENIVQNNLAEGNAVVGITVAGAGGFLVSGNQMQRNGTGLEVVGAVLPGFVGTPTVELNRSEFNDLGMYIATDLGHVRRNVSARNREDGLSVGGSFATRFEWNRSSYNGGFGIVGDPSELGNVYTDNRCTGNSLGDSDPPGLCK